jgi:hypothetical protein
MKKQDTATKAARSKTVRAESISPEGINVVNFSTVPDLTEAPATETDPVTEAAPTSTAAPVESANGVPEVAPTPATEAPATVAMVTEEGLKEVPTAKAPKATKKEKAPRAKNELVAKVPAPKVSKEVKSAIAILKLATLIEMPKWAPRRVLDAIALPSQEAIEALIEQAKILKIDITKGSWQKKAVALNAGHLKSAK